MFSLNNATHVSGHVDGKWECRSMYALLKDLLVCYIVVFLVTVNSSCLCLENLMDLRNSNSSVYFDLYLIPRATISMITYRGYFLEYVYNVNHQNKSSWTLEREFNLLTAETSSLSWKVRSLRAPIVSFFKLQSWNCSTSCSSCHPISQCTFFKEGIKGFMACPVEHKWQSVQKCVCYVHITLMLYSNSTHDSSSM